VGPFFVAMGIFSRSLQSSGTLDAIAPFIQHSAEQLGLFAVVLLPLVMIGLSVIGFHPFITIVLFGTILAATPMKLPMFEYRAKPCCRRCGFLYDFPFCRHYYEYFALYRS